MQENAKIFTQVFGQIIKRHREDKKSTIYRISAESSMPKTTWLRIENGQYKDIKLSSFLKIADGLEIEPCVLMKELQEELGEDFCLGDE